MSHSDLVRVLLVCTSLLGTACTKKTIVAAPAMRDSTGSPAGSPTSTPPSAAPMSGGAAPPALADATPSATGADAADGATGTPAAAIDCALAVPCRWVSDDEAFAVTLTSGDDTGARGGLSIAFRVETLHDSDVAFGGGSEALSGDGKRFTPIARSLGDGNGIAPLGVQAGTPATGRIEHAESAGEAPLALWRIGLLDNGLVREAAFANVPLGPAPSQSADCAFTLPCTWTAGDGSASVTLLAAGGFDDARRLTIGFGVTTLEDDALALDGASALGVDGTRFESRRLAIGTSGGHEIVRASTIGGIESGGNIEFSRVATTPRALARVELGLHRDAPVPRWRIVYESVPLP